MPPSPAPSEAQPEGPADGLYTAQDLFGDLVDAPMPPPVTKSSPRSGPVKIQIAEKNPPVMPPNRGVDLPPEEMASLIDAFGGEEPAPRPVVAPIEASRSPLASGAAELDTLLHNLDTSSEGESDPVPSPRAAVEAAPAAPAEAPEAAEDFGALFDRLTTNPQREEPAPAPDLVVPEIPPSPDEAEDVGGLLETFLRSGEPAPENPPGIRFEVAPPSAVPPKDAQLIDLAALADEALSLPMTEAESPAARAAPPSAFGPYRLLERISAGGMAEVFRAKRTGVEGFEKVLAVKRILPHLSENKEFVEMFIDEAKMVAGLTHPNIVQIFDLGKIDTMYFLAMEHVQGKDLRTILKRAKELRIRMPLDLSVLVVSKVCSALEYAHRKRDEEGQPLGIVHRDISPQNILISFDGEVKLTDFGIAKATSKADTDRGALRGKLLYMSPEQASGESTDRRSDLFSLGVVFYEMITDTKPFLGASEKSILHLVRECRVERPRALNPEIPESLERAVMKALEKDPQQRYQDATEMSRDLDRVLRESVPPSAMELAQFMEVLFDGPSALTGGGSAGSGLDFDSAARRIDIK